MNIPEFSNESLSAGAAVATAILTFFLVLAAIWAGFIANKTMKASQEASKAAQEANDQARRDSIAQTRPYVYAEVVPGLSGTTTYDLKITNTGLSAARNLTLGFEPQDAQGNASDDIVQALDRFFQAPRMLPPGSSIRTWWRIISVHNEGKPDERRAVWGMPEAGVLTVRYTSKDPYVEHEDQFEVMLDERAPLWPVPEGGLNTPKRGSGAYTWLSHFYELGKTMVRRIGEINR